MAILGNVEKGVKGRIQIIDYVITHFEKQGELARQDDAKCYYRHPDKTNVSCAVGCLIPNSAYDEDMEAVAAVALIKRFNLPRWMHDHAELLTSLQGIHDKALNVEDLLQKLRTKRDEDA